MWSWPAYVQNGLEALPYLPSQALPARGAASEFADAALLLAPHARHVLTVVDVSNLTARGAAWAMPDRAFARMSRELGDLEYARLHAAPALIAVGPAASAVRAQPRA